MSGKRILVYLLAAGLLGLLIYALVPNSTQSGSESTEVLGDLDAPREPRDVLARR